METATDNQLPRGAKIYLTAVAVLAAAVAVPQLVDLTPERQDWVEFILLAAGAAVAQLFVVKTPRDQSYHTSIVFVMPAVFLLPLGLVVLMAVVQHVPEWLKVRYPWFIQSFNICNHTINLVAAWGTVWLVLEVWPGGHNTSIAVAALAASAVYVTLNHVLLGMMLKLGRGHSFRETGLFSVESLTTDLVLAGLGSVLTLLWTDNPWLIPAVIAPLILIHRSLSVPALQEERASTRRRACTTPVTSRPTCARSSRVPPASSVRCRSSWPISTFCATSTTRTATWRATPCSRGSPRSSSSSCAITTSRRGSAARSSRFSCPETTPEQALEIAERIRRVVAEHALRGRHVRASRSGRRSPSASPAIRSTAPTRTSSSTRPTSRSTGPSSRDETAR